MKKEQKQQVVEELTARLKAAETLLVADYRGLTMPQIDELRTRLLASGARFTVVKNTLTRRAAEAAGTDALLALLDGPSAIAFLDLLREVGRPDDVRSGLLRLARLVAFGEHRDADLPAAPMREHERAAQLLVGVADVETEAEVQLDRFVELRRAHCF